MPIVVIGGSTKDIGKTALVCAVIAALNDFGWTAVKITAHRYAREDSLSRQLSEIIDPIIREETAAGADTDTARYLAAGARRALLITRNGAQVPIDEIRTALGQDRNIIFESNRVMDVLEPDVCLALTGGEGSETKPSFAKLLHKADALVSVGTREIEMPQNLRRIPRFHLQSLDRLTPEMAEWLRKRVRAAA